MVKSDKPSRLTFIAKAGGKYSLYLCSCGNQKRISHYSVDHEITRSCGCLKRETNKASKRNLIHGDARVGEVSRLHGIWRGILKRCGPNGVYATKGIKVCDEWHEYLPFKTWAMANGYDAALTIDRIDNLGGYHPENCRWADKKQQARNRSTNRIIVIDGQSKTLAEWLEITGKTRSRFLEESL